MLSVFPGKVVRRIKFWFVEVQYNMKLKLNFGYLKNGSSQQNENLYITQYTYLVNNYIIYVKNFLRVADSYIKWNAMVTNCLHFSMGYL
jgi:hypothetical protein